MLVGNEPLPLDRQIEELCLHLQSFHGHRTVWLAADGLLWHAEPDEMLEELGHWYVGTYLRPTPDMIHESIAEQFVLRAS